MDTFGSIICVADILCVAIGPQGYFMEDEIIARRLLWVAAGILLILPQLPLTIAGIALSGGLVCTEKNLWTRLKKKTA